MKKQTQAQKKADNPAETWDRFVNIARNVANVPKEEIEKREKAWRKRRT